MSCDNPNATEAEETMPRRRKFDKTGICIKCKITKGQLVIRHAVYCKDCFFSLIKQKFRGVLDPTLKTAGGPPRGHLKATGNLFIGLSGGLSSTILVDLVKLCYFTAPDPSVLKGGKRHPWKSGNIWQRVVLCYIDCSQAYEGVSDRTGEVKAVIDRYMDVFEFLPLKLEDVFLDASGTDITANLSREDLPVTVLTSTSTPLSRLKTYFSSLPTATSHQSSLTTLIRLLLLRTARKNYCSHLLLGTTLTSLSVNLIDTVASGAGFTIGLEKGENWEHEEGLVKLVRPLREVSMKECAAYLFWRGLEVVGNTRMIKEKSVSKASISGLTKDFVFGLERDYPSTVSAIVRTCNKLVSNSSGERCVFCERPTQSGVQEWKQRISIRSLNESLFQEGTNTSYSDNTILLTPSLCYSCHTMLTSRSSRGTRRIESLGNDIEHVPMPEWVGENVRQSLKSRKDMKEEIIEFLIVDEDYDQGA